MTLGNSANAVTIIRQREESEPHGPHQLLTLEQTNNILGNFWRAISALDPVFTQKNNNQIISTLGQYQPGTPGIKWTEDQASIIRSKILYLWKNWKKTAKDFDFGNPGQQEPKGTNTEYVYDPERKLSTKVCSIYST